MSKLSLREKVEKDKSENLGLALGYLKRDGKQRANPSAKAEASWCLITELKNRKVLKMGFRPSYGRVCLGLEVDKEIIRVLGHDFDHVRPRRVNISKNLGQSWLSSLKRHVKDTSPINYIE